MQFMVLTLAECDAGAAPTPIGGVNDIYAAAAQRAADDRRKSGQYVVFTLQQWRDHQPGRVVAVETTRGGARRVSWTMDNRRAHPRARHDPRGRVLSVERTPSRRKR